MPVSTWGTLSFGKGEIDWKQANKSETIEIRIKAMDRAREITDLFRHRNKQTIHQAVQGSDTMASMMPPSSWTSWII
jgi:hypothetical protein